MTDSNKLWVIDLVDDVIQEKNDSPPSDIPSPPAKPAGTFRRASIPVHRPSPPKPSVKKTPPAKRLHFALLVAFSYLLGPLALLLWTRGKQGAIWMAMAAFSPLGIGGLLYYWPSLLAGVQDPRLLLAMLAGLTVLSLAVFACWTRALHLTFTSRTRAHSAMPQWMRTKWAITVSGFVAPGLGIFLNGKSGRAIAAVWALWPAFLAALILLRAQTSWQWLKSTPVAAQGNAIPEFILLGTLIVTLLGGITWLVQGLFGLHLRSRLCGDRNKHGDRYALALLTAVITLAVVFSPADMAQIIHKQGQNMSAAGFRVLPLQLTKAAVDLAPDNKQYTMTLALMTGNKTMPADQPQSGPAARTGRQRGGSTQAPEQYLATMVKGTGGKKSVAEKDPSTKPSTNQKAKPSALGTSGVPKTPAQSDTQPGPM